jgi:hypothetical protein
MKLKAGRPYDFWDVVAILIRQGDALDLEYVRRWATRLGVIEYPAPLEIETTSTTWS